MRVLVVDDHPLFREGLRALIERLHPDARVIERGSCETALELVLDDHDGGLDLVLLDLALPGMNGLDGIARFRERFVTTPVVVISASYEPKHVKQAIERGAQGFIPKSMPPELLASALEFIFTGGIYVPPDVLAPRTVLPLAPAGAGALTAAQSRVLALMVRGQSNKAIAQALDISDNTVRAHVSAILRALGATNRTEAVAAAIHNGLVTHDA
jgi:two-component system, NarL family, nitrate/nitrite response regulator NarL